MQRNKLYVEKIPETQMCQLKNEVQEIKNFIKEYIPVQNNCVAYMQ